MKKTEWFPADVKPVRVGVYQREYWSTCIGFSHWDGERWGAGYDEFSLAAEHAGTRSSFQELRWRGLAEKPA